MKNHLIFVILILVTVGLNTIAQKFLKQRWNLWLGYGVPALVMMLFLWTVSEPHGLVNDFNKAYYPAGRLIIQNPSGLYDILIYKFVNIPIIAFLFTPFAAFNQYTAQLLFTILGFVAVFTACYFLLKLVKISKWKVALVGLFVFNGPLYYSIREGNTTHFVFLLLVAACFCIQTKHEIWMGILLAVAALIKIPLFLLGVYFAVRGRWRVIVGFSAALLVIVGASVLLFGFDLHLAWFHTSIQPFVGKPISSYNVQSVDGFLARLLLNTNEDPGNGEPIAVGWKFKVIRYALLSLLVGTTSWVCWRSSPPTTLEEENLEFSIVLCLALVLSPISWTHYYLLLLLPFALYLGNRLAVPPRRLWSSLVGVSILLISLPVINAGPANPALSFLYSKLFISHYFFGGVLLLGVLLAARWQGSKRYSRQSLLQNP